MRQSVSLDCFSFSRYSMVYRIIFLTCCSILCYYLANTSDDYLDIDELKRGGDIRNAPHLPSPNSQLWLFVDYFAENQFYPADVFQKFSNVKHMEDCSVLCRMQMRCRTFTYHKTLRQCYMFEVDDFVGVEVFTGLKNVFSKLFDFKNDKRSRSPPRIDDGTAPTVCGMPFFQFYKGHRSKRVLNGGAALFYSMPWMVRLSVKRTFAEGRRVCSGSLISATRQLWEYRTRFIVTSASCVADNLNGFQMISPQITARAGFHDVRFTQPHEQSHDICNVLVPHMSQFTPLNDLVVLVACDSFRYNKYVRPICIPEENETEVAPGAQCYVAGWGIARTRVLPRTATLVDYMNSAVLKRAEVSIIRESQYYPFIYSLLANRNSECGGIACQGDEGGPFFCGNRHGTFTLHGVINQALYLWPKEVPEFSNTCLNVAQFREWLLNTTVSASNRRLSRTYPQITSLLRKPPQNFL